MTTTAIRLAILRPAVRDYEGEWTTRMVQHLYVIKFGRGDWRRAARQDLAQLATDGLLLLDDRDPGRRVYRLNRIHATDPVDLLRKSLPITGPDRHDLDTTTEHAFAHLAANWTPRSTS